MGIHFRRTPTIAMIGALALGGVSIAGAQDTSAAARQDTSGYQTYQNKSDTSKANASTDTALRAKPGVQTGPSAKDSGAAMNQDTSGYQPSSGSSDTSQGGRRTSGKSHFKANGVVTDTALRAKPGVQTGPSAADSMGHHRRHHMRMSAMDTVVCKDGSNAANKGTSVCGSHGGVDSVATRAAMKARGWQGHSGGRMSHDTSSSSSSNPSSSSSSNSSSPNSSSPNSSSPNSSSSNSSNSPSNSSDTSTHQSP